MEDEPYFGNIHVKDRAYLQYRNSAKTIAWLEISYDVALDLFEAMSAIQKLYYIDQSKGVLLDVIGNLVGSPRLKVSIPLRATRCGSGAQAGDPDSQCSAANVSFDQELSDKYYRVLIRSRIIQNTSDCGLEATLDAFNMLTPNAKWIKLIDNGDMSYTVETVSLLTSVERYLLKHKDIAPKPQGVNLAGFRELYNIPRCNKSFEFTCGGLDVQCVDQTTLITPI